ncbi:MAG: sodium-dependent transporter, partial [Lachnospiraceae bacterium]|nr:sodium-dependent transporter [Lachnospiraceae bacterium]
MSNQSSAKRATFSGRLGYVLTTAGSAVGLGNIWRFPYLAAKYGGGIFLLVYLILVLTFGYTLIISKTAIGRMTRKSPIS